MTEPVTGISTTQGSVKKNATESRLKHEKSQRHATETEEDSVEISEEARDRAAGKKRRNILDYLNDDDE